MQLATCLPVQVIVTFEQHSSGLQAGLATSVHRSSSLHPPLLLSHEYTNFICPSLHSSHCAPGGGTSLKHATVIKVEIKAISYISYLIFTLHLASYVVTYADYVTALTICMHS